MSSPDMSAWRALTDLKTRQLQLKQPQFSSSETETETAPCILVTPPSWSSSQTGAKTISARRNNNSLSPLQYRDVHL